MIYLLDLFKICCYYYVISCAVPVIFRIRLNEPHNQDL